MNDVFLSYAREDQGRAQRLAAALAAKGWHVWWDKHISPGKTFDEVIQEALDNTLCVVVLWSERSTQSSWVKEEAAEGARRNILVPCLIDDVRIPLGFGRIQTARLVSWNGDLDHADFEQLCTAIAAIVGASPERDQSSVSALEKSHLHPQPTRDTATESTEVRVPEDAAANAAREQRQPISAGESQMQSQSPDLVTEPPVIISSPWRRFRAPLVAVFSLVILVAGYVAYSGRKPEGTRLPASADVQPVALPLSPQQEARSTAFEKDEPAASAAESKPPQVEIEAVRDSVRRFIAEGNRMNTEALLPFYAEEVDYFGAGVVDHNFIRNDKEYYFGRWPIVSNSLVDEIKVEEAALNTHVVYFATNYEVQSPERGARASGMAYNTLVVTLVDGELKIVNEKQGVQSGPAR